MDHPRRQTTGYSIVIHLTGYAILICIIGCHMSVIQLPFVLIVQAQGLVVILSEGEE